MKKVIYSLIIILSAISCFSQNVEIHEAKIIGSFELGTQEVTTIYDEVTGCERKTAPHTKSLFTPNESVQIKISDKKHMAEVIKPLLSEKVYTNKNCGNGANCLTAFCIINNNENSLILRYTQNNLKVYYNATKRPNNSIQSNLIIYGGNNGNGAIPTSHFLDKTNLEQYKLTAFRNVIEESNKLAKHTGLNISNAEETLIENLILNFKKDALELVQTDLAKSIFFNVAIIKSTKRALVNNSNDCNCAPVPLYFKDKSPFICQKDLAYNVGSLLTNLEENLPQISEHYDMETIEKVKTSFLSKSNQVNVVSFEEFYVEFGGIPTSEFNVNLEDFIEEGWCPIGLGTDLGCCGNYSGCCWYASDLCLIHDVACLTCSEWYCGWCTGIR